MTNHEDEKKKPTVEEISADDTDKVVGGVDRKLTLEEEKRLKKQQAPGPEGTDIGSGGLAPKR